MSSVLLHATAEPPPAADNPSCQLPADEVHVWFVRTDEIQSPGQLASFYDIVSPAERGRHRRFVFAKDRHQFLVSHAMVRRVLSCYATVPPARWSFSTNRYGRPAIESPAAQRQLRFNLSHTPGLAAIALTRNRDVGVDVESFSNRHSAGESVAERYFSPSECAALRCEPAERRGAAFLEFWTLKEAYVKARGMGLSIPLERLVFDRGGVTPPSVRFLPGIADDPSRWQFTQLRPTEDHVLAVAVHIPDRAAVALTVCEARFMR